MKPLLFSQLAFIFAALAAPGQGTFVYDQQSADESNANGASVAIQAFPPIGQSFTPTNSSVGFIRLNFADNRPGNDIGATVNVNLRSDSITGPILTSTTPVTMPDNFGRNTPGFTDFFFPTPVAVTAGLTYYFEVVAQSGDPWSVDIYSYGYPGGTAFEMGTPILSDMWFREGIVVPEPSSALLILIGGGVLVYVRGAHIRKRSLR